MRVVVEGEGEWDFPDDATDGEIAVAINGERGLGPRGVPEFAGRPAGYQPETSGLVTLPRSGPDLRPEAARSRPAFSAGLGVPIPQPVEPPAGSPPAAVAPPPAAGTLPTGGSALRPGSLIPQNPFASRPNPMADAMRRLAAANPGVPLGRIGEGTVQGAGAVAAPPMPATEGPSAFAETPEALGAGVLDVVRSVPAVQESVARLGEGLADEVLGQAAGSLARKLGSFNPWRLAWNALDEKVLGPAQKALEGGESMRRDGREAPLLEKLSDPGWALRQGLRQVPQFATSLGSAAKGATVAQKILGPALMEAGETARSLSENEKATGKKIGDARFGAAVLGKGLAAGALELGGAEALLGRLAKYAPDSVKRRLGGDVVEFLTGSAAEGGTERVQQWIGNFAELMATKKPSMRELFEMARSGELWDVIDQGGAEAQFLGHFLGTGATAVHAGQRRLDVRDRAGRIAEARERRVWNEETDARVAAAADPEGRRAVPPEAIAAINEGVRALQKPETAEEGLRRLKLATEALDARLAGLRPEGSTVGPEGTGRPLNEDGVSPLPNAGSNPVAPDGSAPYLGGRDATVNDRERAEGGGRSGAAGDLDAGRGAGGPGEPGLDRLDGEHDAGRGPGGGRALPGGALVVGPDGLRDARTGEPVTVFRGAQRGAPSGPQATRGAHLFGEHWTPDRAYAEEFAGKRGKAGVVEEAELDVRNPFSVDDVYDYGDLGKIAPAAAERAAREHLEAGGKFEDIPGQLFHKALVEDAEAKLSDRVSDPKIRREIAIREAVRPLEAAGFDSYHHRPRSPQGGKVDAFAVWRKGAAKRRGGGQEGGGTPPTPSAPPVSAPPSQAPPSALPRAAAALSPSQEDAAGTADDPMPPAMGTPVMVTVRGVGGDEERLAQFGLRTVERVTGIEGGSERRPSWRMTPVQSTANFASFSGGAAPSRVRLATREEIARFEREGGKWTSALPAVSAPAPEIRPTPAPAAPNPAPSTAAFEHVGKEGTTYTAGGEPIGYRWVLVDMNRDVVASHRRGPGGSLEPNPDFVAEFQPRDRERMASERQVETMSKGLRPEMLGDSPDAGTGAPIVGPDRIIESGNGRTLAIQEAYRTGRAEGYRQWAERTAPEKGFTAEQVRAIEAPGLLRLRTTPTEDRRELVKQFNVPAVAKMSAAETARADADRLTPALLARFQPSEDGLAILAARNRDFVSGFLSTVPENERSELLDEDGQLNKDGRKRIENALLGKAYGRAPILERITEATDDNARLVSGALLNAAPAMATLRGAIEAGDVRADVDPTPAIVEAVQKLSWLRDEGGTVESYLQQDGLFGDEMTPAGREVLKAFDGFKRSGKKVTAFLTAVAQSAILEGDARQTDLFADAPPARLEDIVRAARRFAADGGQGGLFGGGEDLPLAPQDGPGSGGVPGGRSDGAVDRPRVSRTPGLTETGTDPRHVLLVERYARRLGQGWADAPALEVVQDETGLPDELRALAGDSRVEGVYVPNEDRVYLVAGSLRSRADVERVVLHEVMGHAGLRRLIGREEFGSLMDKIADSLPRDVEAKARAYGLDLKDREQRREAADEVLAEWASRPETPPRAITRAIVALRGVLRRIFPSLRWTPDDVRALLARARRRVEEGGAEKRGPRDDARFSRAQESTDAFRAWFGDSKVVDEEGRPKVVYHGARRPDRVGSVFRRSRATSGPMAFFTENPEVASSYATKKADTSLEAPDDYAGWFKVKVGRSEVPVDRAWYFLSEQQRAALAKNIPHVVWDNEDGNDTIRLGGENEYGLAGKGHWDYTLQREARGNPLRAAVEVWLNSGGLFDQEERFLDVLRAAGLSNVKLDSPWAENPGVFPVYLAIRNPLDTSAIPEDVVRELERASWRQGPPKPYGPDQWSKHTQEPRTWMERLRGDLKEGKTSYAWTSIPDWVTRVLQRRGYDGIKDTGGKGGGNEHVVWIPFEETQVKSATGNRGTFDRTKKDIRFSRAVREEGLPREARVISSARNTRALKSHPDYEKAKAGDPAAAVRVVNALVGERELAAAREAFGDDVLFVWPHAEEEKGRNKLPAALAAKYAAAVGASFAPEIVQANRAFHTGAGAMERLIARPLFDGEVVRGARYVVADDVTTMGSTLSELADHIRAGGGEVAGVVVLADASREGKMAPDAALVRAVKGRFGDALESELHVRPEALTAAEARYVAGFRDAESLRARVASAGRERDGRLHAKGIRPLSSEVGSDRKPKFSRTFDADAPSAAEERVYRSLVESARSRAAEAARAAARVREELADPGDILEARRDPELPTHSREIQNHIRPAGRKADVEPLLRPWEALYQQVIRRHYALEKAGKALGADERPAHQDPGVVAELSAGHAARAEQLLAGKGGFRLTRDGGIEWTGNRSLEAVLSDLGPGRLNELRRYLVARRAIELHHRQPQQQGLLGEDEKTIYSGISEAAAQQEVAGAPDDVKRAAEEVTALLDDALRYWAEAGGLSAEAVETIRDLNRAYVPFYRVFEGQDPARRSGRLVLPAQRGAALQAEQAVKRIWGGGADILDPLVAVADHIQRMIRAADLNRVGKTLVEAAALNPERALGLVEEIPQPNADPGATREGQAVQDSAEAYGVSVDDEAAAAISFLSDKKLTFANDRIRVWQDGKLREWRVEKSLGEALRALGPDDVSLAKTLLSFPARMLRSGVTKNPIFALHNFLRDTGDASVQSRNGFRPFLDSAIGLVEAIRNGELRKEWLAAGGGYATLAGGGIRGAENALKEVAPKTIGQSVLRTVRHPLEALGLLNRPFEEAARLGEYRLARQKGKSATEAALDAARITTNFTVHGTDAFWWGLAKASAFVNPAIQGSDRAFRTVLEAPRGEKQTPQRALAAAANVVFKGLLNVGTLSALFYLLGDDDDEIKELRRTKQGAMWWFARVPGTKVIVRFPKPFLWGQVFGTGVEAAIDRAKGENPRAYKEWRQEVLDMLVDGVLPVPTVAKTGFELALNRSIFFRRPIVTRSLEGVEPRYQANPSTSQVARRAGDLLNVSPAKIEYGVVAIGGTLGREVLRAGDSVLGKGDVSRPAPRLGDLPLVGRAFARTPDISNDSTETFYEELGEVRKAAATMKLLRKQDPEEARRRAPEYRRALAAERIYEGTAERLADLRKAIERTNKAPDTTYSREEKRKRVDFLALRMTDLARRVVDRRLLEEPAR